MTSERSYSDYLGDIIDAMGKIGCFIEGLSEQKFQEDDKTAFAVIRALEIIGEATKRLPDTFRSAYPQIPWKTMAGMWDKLIHQYMELISESYGRQRRKIFRRFYHRYSIYIAQ